MAFTDSSGPESTHWSSSGPESTHWSVSTQAVVVRHWY